MKKILIALLCILPTLGIAETAAPVPTPPSTFDELRQQRPVILEYFESLLVRNFANDFASAMHDTGFNDDQIREVLNGRSFNDYSQRVLRDPQIAQALDHFLNRLLATGVLEAMMQKKSLEQAARQQASLALAVEELVRAQRQNVLSEETPKAPPSIWQRILAYMTKDLF